MSAVAIADEVAELLEPDPEKRDDTRTRPRGGSEWVPDRLYVWCEKETFVRPVTGPQDEERFVLRVAWVVDDTLARAGGEEDRDVSLSIDAKVAAIRTAVLAAAGTAFEDLHLDAVDYAGLTTNEHRGFFADISGYQLGD